MLYRKQILGLRQSHTQESYARGVESLTQGRVPQGSYARIWQVLRKGLTQAYASLTHLTQGL